MEHKGLITAILWLIAGLLLTGASGIIENAYLFLVGTAVLATGIYFTVTKFKK